MGKSTALANNANCMYVIQLIRYPQNRLIFILGTGREGGTAAANNDDKKFISACIISLRQRMLSFARSAQIQSQRETKNNKFTLSTVLAGALLVVLDLCIIVFELFLIV